MCQRLVSLGVPDRGDLDVISHVVAHSLSLKKKTYTMKEENESTTNPPSVVVQESELRTVSFHQRQDPLRMMVPSASFFARKRARKCAFVSEPMSPYTGEEDPVSDEMRPPPEKRNSKRFSINSYNMGMQVALTSNNI